MKNIMSASARSCSHYVAALFVLAMANLAHAAPVTLTGDTFDVTYDDTEIGLFGTPRLSGDTLFFLPTDFSASSVNDGGAALVNDTFTLVITPHEGYSLTSFGLREEGDYLLDGSSASASVNSRISVRAEDDPIMSWSSNGQTELSTAGFGDWESNVELEGEFSFAGSVILTLEDILVAKSLELGDYAFIEKKFVSVPVGTVIPLPATLSLFGSAVVFLMGGVIRRKQTA